MNSKIYESALREAAGRGDFAAVVEMLAVPAEQVRQGVLPIHVAAASGVVEAAQLLLEHGADVNACDVSSGMPLHYAIRKGRVEMVAFLLGRGAEANARKRFRGPMETAAMRGNLEIVRLLLEHGAEGSWESLRVAARNGNREIAACLLDHGCFAGEREIMDAAIERHIGIVELLVAHRGSGRGVPATEEERLIDTVGYLMEWGSAPRSRVIVEYLKPRGAAGAAALAHYRAALLRAAEKEGEAEIAAELQGMA